jgi:plastocyanin
MPMSRWLTIAAIATAAACSSNSSTGYGGNPPPPPPPPPAGGHSTTITVANNTFAPTPDTIPAGNITFHWATGAFTHNVSWDTGPGTLPAASGNRAAGDPDYVASLVVGTYTYHCLIHGASMSGRIVVTP